MCYFRTPRSISLQTLGNVCVVGESRSCRRINRSVMRRARTAAALLFLSFSSALKLAFAKSTAVSRYVVCADPLMSHKCLLPKPHIRDTLGVHGVGWDRAAPKEQTLVLASWLLGRLLGRGCWGRTDRSYR